MKRTLLFLLSLAISHIVIADPTTEPARLSVIDGVVSFLPVDQSTWVEATLNRPVIVGDGLWADVNSRAEAQLSGAAVRLGPQTSVSVSNATASIIQYKVAEGALILSVQQLNAQQTYEIDTPMLALIVTKPGYYRVDVQASATTVTVREGDAEVYGQEKTSLQIKEGQVCQFGQADVQQSTCLAVGPLDALDTWSMARDNAVKQSLSGKYVSRKTIGYADLDTHGKWKENSQYGQVWIPSNVSGDWAPYAAGQWVWEDDWGWTWIDDQPWGFAPFHYGRWAYVEEQWAWVPGPLDQTPLYASALVAFSYPLAGVGAGAPGIGWFPLGPGDVFVPSFNVSANYFTQINISNTVINPGVVNNFYNNPTINSWHYQNIERKNAITTMPSDAFVASQRVQGNHIPYTENFWKNPHAYAPLSPDSRSIFGGRPAAKAHPAAGITERSVITKNVPPARQAKVPAQATQLRQEQASPKAVKNRSEQMRPQQRVQQSKEQIRAPQNRQPQQVRSPSRSSNVTSQGRMESRKRVTPQRRSSFQHERHR